MNSDSPWPQEYYAALRFFYWEPQWLNRHANAKLGEKTPDQVSERLGQSEVALNHLLNLFFSIAPNGLVGRFFQKFLNGWSGERVETHIRPALPTATNINICQTDLLFEGATSRIAMEIKIGHKTSLEQIVKYALFLHHFGPQIDGSLKRPFLLFLSPSPNKIWKTGLSLDTYRDALDGFEFRSTVQRFSEIRGHSRADVLTLAAALPVAHVTFREFHDFLDGETAALDGSDGSETLRNLIGGLIAELSKRGLVG